ncbi:hypothetical protein [Anaerosporobacter sp.]|uniref:hypothetical protein n=1 Tax=Anaerosporobacter sp. TaxID=1872529 RepID=UPI00286ED938|nr:hypothetical protein [Anaerosporobacter sp.]
MENKKKDSIQFFVWLRNGIAFCTTWFLILMLVYSHFFNIQSISTRNLTKMIFCTSGGVLLFNLIFLRMVIKKWSFIKRLTCFMLLFSIYECFCFYWFGLFAGKGTINKWSLFIGIAFVLYIICMAIYQQYNKKQSDVYTQALQRYQQKRGGENGE